MSKRDAVDAADRVVFLGDSITDGDTYRLMVEQALREAGLGVPECINAGVSGDTIAQMRDRLDRDVLAHDPSCVTIHAGANDATRGVAPGDYEADLRAMVGELLQQEVGVVLLTPTPVGPRHAVNRPRLAGYEQAIRAVAEDHDLTVGEVGQAFNPERQPDPPADLLEPDQLHISLPGYKRFTRAVLDALGHPQVPVPAHMTVTTLPGVITPWRIRPAEPDERSLDADTLTGLEPSHEAWQEITLPHPAPLVGWWPNQVRQQGYATNLPAVMGVEARQFLAVAEVKCDAASSATLSVGAELREVWLNGERVYRSEGWRGFHAGRETVAVTLSSGSNTFVIGCSSSFFLALCSAEASGDRTEP